jgi:hypothetical protein
LEGKGLTATNKILAQLPDALRKENRNYATVEQAWRFLMWKEAQRRGFEA